MTPLSFVRSTALAGALLGLAGCVTAPKPLQGEFVPLSPEQASDADRTGDRVRWGGQIVDVQTRADRTCFELLGKPLGASARPREADVSDGRFLACRRGFYDPALFAPGRELTVTGVVEAYEERPIGEYRYRYPRIDADVVYLWPEREPDHHYRYAPAWPMYHPFWGPSWRPYRVIVRQPPPPPPKPDGG